ncbi:uncharacterized protein B0H64DRAFT_417276 [Chaetomium fimeti]|uniref:ABC transporter domain-containing protein n=1 Tax=Chaetomium fimeti TaxID=1854472 RepID=A0AAE0HFI1_9PEZI|nr:hypothetical protein B0H64DRAFT_417276 [Chaetomium fimeti]
METYSMAAPQLTGSSTNGSPSVSSDSPGTATSSTTPMLSATTDARLGQQPAAPPSRGKHLKCDGNTPCSRCTSSNQECLYVPSRRGYKGPRRGTAHNPNKRHASSSPPYPGAEGDSCPMLLGHGGVSLGAPALAAFNPGIVLPEQSPASYTTPSPMSNVPLYRNPFAQAMDPNALALATTTPAAPPVQPPAPSLADRCFDAFYHFFHAGHPFVLPKDYFIRMLKEGTEPNLNVVMAAMKYIGSLYVDAGPAKATYLDDAIRLCYQPGTPKDGYLIQALLLIIVGLDGQCNQARARELLADCEQFAMEIDLNKRSFATMHGRGNPVLEESWRRTWWDLYVCDGMIAGVHRVTKFLLFNIQADVGLPCEEQQYLTGPQRIPQTLYMEDFDDQGFSDEDREFSSFTYRIAAARNLGRMMHTPPVLFPDDAIIDRVQSLLTNWRMHLPDSKRDDLSKSCQLDEMMFQAHFITHACTLMLHQPLSQLDTTPVQAVNSCAPHRPVPSGDVFNAHTRHTLSAASEISKMITQAVPITHHTHFFTCVITLSSIVHLSKWALYFVDDEDHLRQQIRLNIGALNKISKVWKAADTAWGQVKGVAQEIYREKKAQQISPAFWVGFTQEQMMSSISADEGIMSEFTTVGAVGNVAAGRELARSRCLSSGGVDPACVGGFGGLCTAPTVGYRAWSGARGYQVCEILAVLGPSGSGKTTLLNHLATRPTPSALTTAGDILLNGHPQPASSTTTTPLRSVTRFVEQDDSLVGALSVRETLTFTARLSSSSSSGDWKARAARVEALLEGFGLRAQADTLVGTALRGGVSGGQKRRLGVACQLVGEGAPRVLVLDEPTSGLDSLAGWEVLIVIASIHQPSTATFNLFDKLLLMSHGKTHYFGPVKDVAGHYESIGHPMPLHVNPAEFLLEMVNTDFAQDTESALQRLHEMQFAWTTSRGAKQLTAAVAAVEEKGSGALELDMAEKKPSLPSVVLTLMHRSFVKSYRDVVVYGIRLAIGSAFMSFMAVAYSPAYLEDYMQFIKEKRNGLYGSTAMIISNFLTGIPYLFIIALVFSSISYWLSNLQPTPQAFFTWVLWVFLDLLAAESLVVLLTSLFPSFVISLALIAFANGLWMSVNGFMVPPTVLNVFYKYVFHFWDYQKYVFENMMVNEFSERVYSCATTATGCQCMWQTDLADQCLIRGQGVLDQYGYKPGYMGKDIGIMMGIIAGYRIAAWIVLMLKNYTAAIHILSGLLSDGNTTTALQHPHHLPNQNLKPKPALIPPPSQIALLTTLIIHPSFTTRPPEISNTHAASHALSYLRGLLSTVGAVNANFRAAFQFGDAPTTTTTSTTTNKNTRYGGPRTGTTSTSSNNSNHNHNNNNSTSDSDDDDDSDDALTGPFARSQLLFRRAPDFWAVLGWAFRCAAEQPRRWRHWRVWLGLAVSVLEADFDERLARDRDRDRDREGVVGRGKGKSVSAYPALGQSLLVGYLRGLGRERRNVLKEVLRGLFAFADGENGVADRAVFREVFERETVVKGAGSGKRKREDTMVDLENDRFGDYLDGDEFESGGEEEDGAGRVPTPKGRRKPGRKPKAEATPSFILTDDIAETVSFRLRIFRLLSAVSYYLPDTFARVDELYERFTDHVRSLPLAMFRLFVEPHPADLPEDVRVSFLRMLIEEMLPRHHPEPADVDPDNASATGVSVLVLQECFLPFPANKVTAEDNAKLSLALESMLWFVYSQIDVAYSPELRQAVEKGIKAREDNIKNKRGGRPDKAAKDVLARSARNLRALVDVIAVAGE